jgi:hypothetical protein
MIVTYLLIPKRPRFQAIARTSTKRNARQWSNYLPKISGGLPPQTAGDTYLLDATAFSLCSAAATTASNPRYSTQQGSKAPAPRPRRCRTACRCSRAPFPGQTVTQLSAVDPVTEAAKASTTRLLSSAPSSVFVLWSEHISGRAGPDSITSWILTTRPGLAVYQAGSSYGFVCQ